MILSIIIPCFNDEHALTTLLSQLIEQITATNKGSDIEIIVVDATQYTEVSLSISSLLSQCNGRVIRSLPCRGKQLNIGAGVAVGDKFWFVHADATLSADALIAVINAVDAGYFTFKFSAPYHFLRWGLEKAIALRNTYGVAYGDQALFMTRALFYKYHGFEDVPLFEEVKLVKHLKKNHTFKRLPLPVYIDCRRWQRTGWVKQTLRNRWLVIKYMFGKKHQTLADAYQAFITKGKE